MTEPLTDAEALDQIAVVIRNSYDPADDYITILGIVEQVRDV